MACSKADKVVEHTDQLVQETEEVAEKTEEVAQTTNYAVRIKRQNDSSTLRSRQFEIIMSDRTGMGQKLSAAALYFKNFEYQLWNPKENSFDTLELRDELKREALTELYQKLGDVFNILLQKNFWGKTRLQRMSPLELSQNGKGINEHNIEMVFYALASMSHYNNIIQVKAVRENEDITSTESIYDLIRHSLSREKNGEHLNQSDDIMLAGDNRTISIELLRARFNILLALATKDMATTEGLSFGRRFSRFWYGLTGGGLGSLAVRSSFQQTNLPTQKDINNKLSAALKVKHALEKAGHSVEPHEDLKSMLENIEIDDTEAKSNMEYRRFLAYLNALTR